MKNKNLVATLAIIAVSAIPLMAHQQLDTINIDKDLVKKVNSSIQTEFATIQQNQSNELAEKYNTLTEKFKIFTNLMKDESLNELSEENAGQKIFMVIDGLAQSVLEMPQPARDAYITLLQKQEFRFAYQHNKKVTLNDLYTLAKDLKSIFISENTPIVKFLNTKSSHNISTWKMNQYDKELVYLINESIQEITYGIDTELYKALSTFLTEQNKASSMMIQEKYKAQTIWMAIDDLAKVVLKFPEDEKDNEQKDIINRFKENNIDLLSSYNFSKEYVYYHGSAIESLINKYYNPNK